MARSTPVVGTFTGEELEVSFYAFREHHPEGDLILDIDLQDVTLLGHLIPDIKVLPEALQASIIALADDIETWMGRC